MSKISPKRICELCHQPPHRHLDRHSRWRCEHCGQELCSLQVTTEDPRNEFPEEEGVYFHADGFCPGTPEKK